MSEVKRYKVVKMLSEVGNGISYDPHGPYVVLAEDYDAALAREAEVIRERDALIATVTKASEREAALREELRRVRSLYDREVLGLNNEGDPIGGDPAGGYKNENADLRQRLTAAENRADETESDAARWRFFSETANNLQAFPHSWGHMTPEKMDFMCDEAMRAVLKPVEGEGS